MHLSVVIPAHNEAGTLPATLRGIRQGLAAVAPGRSEILVVDNASTDGTAEVAKAHGARVVGEPHRQIGRARNTGARAAGGEFLLFVDADTLPGTTLLSRALAELEAGACGGGARVAVNELPNRVYRLGLGLWNLASRRWSLAAGCFVFARRDGFEAVGGFDQRYYAGDEVWLSLSLRRWGREHGRRFVIIDEPPVVTSTRKAEWFSPLQHVLTTLMILLCPPVLRSRRLMWFWYRRPAGKCRD